VLPRLTKRTDGAVAPSRGGTSLILESTGRLPSGVSWRHGEGPIVAAPGPSQSRVRAATPAIVPDGTFRAVIDQILNHAGPRPLAPRPNNALCPPRPGHVLLRPMARGLARDVADPRFTSAPAADRSSSVRDRAILRIFWRWDEARARFHCLAPRRPSAASRHHVGHIDTPPCSSNSRTPRCLVPGRRATWASRRWL